MSPSWKKKIVLFLASQMISLFGSALVQHAIMWHITLETKSGIMMTISIISGFLPSFFLSPFAGVWADRYNRKLLVILSDSFIAISTLIVAIIFLMGYEAFWLFFALSAIRSIGSAVQSSAISAILPQLVPADELTKVFMVIIGVAMPVFNTPAMVILQQRVEGDYLGRVFSIMSMLASIVMPMGMLIFGPLADIIPIESLLVTTGILIIILCIFMWKDKVLLEAGKPVKASQDLSQLP